MNNEELALLAQSGDKKALHTLWEQNTGVLFILLKKYFPLCKKYNVEEEDLLQLGYFIICNAAQAYNKDKPFKFTAYLHNFAKTEVGSLLSERKRLGKHSQELKTVSGNIEIATDVDGGVELFDTIPDKTAQQAFEVVEDNTYTQKLHNDIEQAIEQLPQPQASIVRHRYWYNRTVNEVAKEENTSTANIRRLERHGLNRLSRDKNIKQYKENIVNSSKLYWAGLSSFKNNQASSVELSLERLELLEQELERLTANRANSSKQ